MSTLGCISNFPQLSHDSPISLKLWHADDIFPRGQYREAILNQDSKGVHTLFLRESNGQAWYIHPMQKLGTGDLASRLHDTYLRIQREYASVHMRLKGGMMETVCSFLFAEAMQRGAAFIAGDGQPEATSVKVELMCEGKPIKGRYTGRMAKVSMPEHLLNQWVPYGEGKVMMANGDWYDGLWLKGRFCNTGTYETANGSWRYEGQWRDGERVGYGKLFTQDSQGKRVLTYEGGWKKGLFEGRGTYIRDGKEQFGEWKEGKLLQEKSTEEKCKKLATSTVPEVVAEVLAEFHADIPLPEQDKINSAKGFALNHSIAQALGNGGALFSIPLTTPQWPLPLGMMPTEIQLPSLKLHSFDASDLCPSLSALCPLVVSSEPKNINLENLVLPKSVVQSVFSQEFIHQREGRLDALAWVQYYAAKFERRHPEDKAAPFAHLIECSIPHQILAVGLPVDPQKEEKAQFAPLLEMPSTLPDEGATWGYIAWTNNGQQHASECVHAYAQSDMRIMTAQNQHQRSWAIQAIGPEGIPETQFIRIRDKIDQSLANALHFVLFRYIETPAATAHHGHQGTTPAPATGELVRGEHIEKDIRGTYEANVYRKLDPNSLICVTLIGLPISLQHPPQGPSPLQYCIKSHLDRMKELVQLERQGQ